MGCPRCSSEMLPDNDHVNRVNVLVCSNPTCLYRVYPDYPRRNGNEEICYFCGKIFKVFPDDLGVLCPECKERVWQKKNSGNTREKTARPAPTPDREIRIFKSRRRRFPKLTF
jgi:hypothetical protein